MTRTELYTNLIKNMIEQRRYMPVDQFRDMFTNHLPGRLTFLAFSRDGQWVLPVFDHDYHHNQDETVDYTTIRREIGNDWTPVLTAHVWHRTPGNVPQTLLTVDGILDEKVLHRTFGTLPPRHDFPGTVRTFNFGHYDPMTLPPLAMYTIDHLGARRIRTMNERDEGRVYDVHVDPYGYVRYLDRDTNRIVMGRFELDRVDLEWKLYERTNLNR